MKTNTLMAIALMAGIFVSGCSKDEPSVSLSEELQEGSKSDAKVSANVYISNTIVVAAGQTYDGQGNTIIAQGMGDGSQNEGQKAVFRLENGATLKNVKIGIPGCDGVHTYGNATLSNVEWVDVGEDAMTMKAQGNVTLNNCIARKAYDKIIQINANGNLTLNNFYADTFGKVVRTNGGSTYNNTITINGGTFRNGTNIVRTDSRTTYVRHRNMSVSNVSQWWLVPNSSQVTTY